MVVGFVTMGVWVGELSGKPEEDSRGWSCDAFVKGSEEPIVFV